MTTWFTSDLHFGHANIIEYSGRPFRDVDHMNRALIERWNALVQPADTVWVLGDVAMGRITDTLTSGQVFTDLGLPRMDPEDDRAMVCGSLAFNHDVKAVLEKFGLHEGANSEPMEFVVEKAFVGDGI